MKVIDTKREALGDLMDAAGITAEDLAITLGLTASAVYNKIARRRPWSLAEVGKVLALLTTKLKRRVVFEMVEDFSEVA